MDPSEAGSRLAGAPDEMSFGMKMQNEDIERRLQTLFARGDEEELQQDKKNVAREVDEQYMSVNEEMTTDTPLTSEMEDKDMKRASLETDADAASAKAQKMLKQQAGIASSSDDEAQEAPSEVGIQSSDEEREAAATTEQLSQPEPKEEEQQTRRSKDRLFEDERERENIVHQFNFDDDDVNRFRESLHDRFEIKSRFDS